VRDKEFRLHNSVVMKSTGKRDLSIKTNGKKGKTMGVDFSGACYFGVNYTEDEIQEHLFTKEERESDNFEPYESVHDKINEALSKYNGLGFDQQGDLLGYGKVSWNINSCYMGGYEVIPREKDGVLNTSEKDVEDIKEVCKKLGLPEREPKWYFCMTVS
jgi:hypothetical protein